MEATPTEVSTLTINLPDDWHVHLRDGDMLRHVVGYTAEHFGRALVMPNLKGADAILTVSQAQAYAGRIKKALPKNAILDLAMTIKIGPQTKPEIIYDAKAGGVIAGKLYPDGVTTNSEGGVRNFRGLWPIFETMQKTGLVLSIHGETPAADIDCIDAEEVFVGEILSQIHADFPGLAIVLEHITTKMAVDFINACDGRIAATITPHHLEWTMNDVRRGTFKPHRHCLPEAKRFRDRDALRQAAMGGNPRFFLGTDSAPHAKHTKECAECCAGVFNAPVTIAALASLFSKLGKLESLEGFCSRAGASFYGFSQNAAKLELAKQSWTVPDEYPGSIVPFLAGQTLDWKVIGRIDK